MIQYLSKLLYVVTGKRIQLAILVLTFFVSSGVEVFGVGLIGPFLNIAIKPSSIQKIPVLNWIYEQLHLQSTREFIPLMGLAITCSFIIQAVLLIYSQKYLSDFSYNQQRILTNRLIHSYLAAPYTFHLSKNTAHIIKNIISETTLFTQGCLMPSLRFINYLVITLLFFVLLAKTSSVLLILVLGVILPIFLLFNQLGGKLRQWGKHRSESQKEIVRTINHSLGGFKETRILGCESYFRKEVEHQSHVYSRASTLFTIAQMLPNVIIKTVLIMILVLYIAFAETLFNQNLASLTGVIGIFAVAAMRLTPVASGVITTINQLQNSGYTLDMLYLDLKELEKENTTYQLDEGKALSRSNNTNSNLPENETLAFENQIDLVDISYRYPGSEEPSLDHIFLSIKKGESIALIGKSGAGKTTLVDVILGLLIPESGDIQVDGVSVYNNLRSWQNLVGYIPQSIFLLDDTIEKNIAFGVPNKLIDQDRLFKAIKAAQLEEVVEQLPKGIKTEIGERGVRLSGGQRQRIGIARALYHEREILVLDEATSALDNETERLVTEAIKSLAGSKTLIIIAHRLTTVEHCNRIYMLNKGSIVKSGSYQEVVTS
ncbi:ABC transporter ATP-binding protein [Gloeothece verrucosa]|uniref:ABC transporter related protein n=1 Tax=Gloeothece verrucosa (strain PCC 7822) TaxID=497965 RepID=E0UDJ5_GLOV7|nr:ABC transporter ATP-binding protein [Gloeothece verrucosa]ADN15308.1 ABC transporter related protein [Gloeothece verrucosa PCC 7822]